ncbi:nitrogenase-associated protein [Bradyrhizobium sp. i1.8.4]
MGFRRRRHRTEDVTAKDILTEPCSPAELRRFFCELVSWFNRAAPRIKSVEVNPDTMDAARALALMAGDPLLLRRPSINIDRAGCAGFDHEPALSLLGRKTQADLERCSHDAKGTLYPQR